METIIVNHIYEAPELYQIIYEKSLSYKVAEAQAFSYLLQLYGYNNSTKINDILEIASGDNSYHRDIVLSILSDSKIKYDQLDKIKNIDLSNWSYTKDKKYDKYNAIVAYYYSLNAFVDFSTSFVTKENNVKILKNIYDHLTDKGIFIVDSCQDGYRCNFELVSNTMTLNTKSKKYDLIDTYQVPYNSKLVFLYRDIYNITPNKELQLKTYFTSYYDRFSGNSIEEYKFIDFIMDERVIARYKVTKPFCIRHFSEIECIEMLQQAGFSNIDLWSCNYRNNEYIKLEDKYSLSELIKLEVDVITDELIEYISPNVFVCLKTK